MIIFGKLSWKEQRTIGQWLLRLEGKLQLTWCQTTPTLFLKESNLPTQTDPRDLNLSKLEIHMVIQDITTGDHGEEIVKNGQNRTLNKLVILKYGVQCKESSGSHLNFSLKTGLASPWLITTRTSLIQKWLHKLTLQLKKVLSRMQIKRRLIMSTDKERTHTTL